MMRGTHTISPGILSARSNSNRLRNLFIRIRMGRGQQWVSHHEVEIEAMSFGDNEQEVNDRLVCRVLVWIIFTT